MQDYATLLQKTRKLESVQD